MKEKSLTFQVSPDYQSTMKQTIFITGASSGTGKATATLFLKHGWNVVATMRDPSKETELSQSSDVLVTRLDVQDQSSIEDAVKAAIERFGRIDVLCNNAGYGQYGLFEALPREQMQKQFDVNVFGVMDVTRKVLPHFRANQRGTIINVGSGAGIFGLPVATAYCASKFALEGFTEALSYELASQHITVKLVTPYSGVANTSFGGRAMEEMSQEAPQEAPLKDYNAFMAHTNAFFGSLFASIEKTSDDIAEMIFGAATDGTNQLRYLIGGDDTRPFIEARRGMSDQDYITFMRETVARAGDTHKGGIDFIQIQK